ESGFIDPGKLTITRRNTTLLASLAAKGVNILSSNTDAVKQADCIILAVKPFQIKDILIEIKPFLDPQKQILVSVVTGVWINDILSIV
ncbi:pyrroline-5-carboxylate reductase family protein, partial [Staphylococcus aureus]